MMPVMDGFEASIEIRKFEKLTKKTPCMIVALSGNGSESTEEKVIFVVFLFLFSNEILIFK